MKPVRLTLQAFGPYPDRQEIDFREAVEGGLFGIYGQTGSGKSTVFSAMTFALFGTPAKDDQAAMSLRSDHAAADLPTEVEFVFEIGARRYVVVRRPDQMRPRLRGQGETKTPHEAFLFDATDVAVDAIREGQRGKVIAEKKVGVVDAAIVDRLGYGASQFRQIVLLPQGRFETFLSAKTKDRLEILRDLFDVSLYRQLTVVLKERADAAERQVQRAREVHDQRLAAEGFESDAALEEGIAAMAAAHAIQQQAVTDARAASDAAQAALQAAERVEDLFRAKAVAEQRRAAVQATRPEIDRLAAQVAQAERAQGLVDVERAVMQAAADRHAAAAVVARAEATASQMAAANHAAADALAAERGREAETEGLRSRERDFVRYQTILADAAGSQAEVVAAQAAEAEGAQRLAVLRDQLEQARTRSQDLAATLKTARDREARRQDGEARRQGLQHQIAQAEAVAAAEQAVAAALRALEDARLASAAAHARVQACQATFDAVEAKVLRQQAVQLASRLAEGEPCPVCGGRDHPAPASGPRGEGETESKVRRAESDLRAADQAARRADQALAAAKSVLEERQDRLSTLPRPQQSRAALLDQHAAVEAALTALGAVMDVATLERALEHATADLAMVEAERERRQDEQAGLGRAAAAVVAQRDAMLAAVPPDLRDEAVVSAQLAATRTALEARVRMRRQAEDRAVAARDAALSAAKDVEAAQAAFRHSQDREAMAVATFTQRLEQAGLTVETYESLKPALAQVCADRDRIEAFRRTLATAEEVARQAAAAVEGITRPDLVGLTAARDHAAGILAGYLDQLAEYRGRLQQMQSLRDSLAAARQAVEQIERDSAPLRGLAAAVTGNTPQKLDLETYAIAAMFEAVLQAANLRLGPMTAYRYQLVRDAEGSGRARRGLGIQVFDAHTGKDRPTATLSGGETFIAALALALGLADVVESSSGRVQLDTIFIDEGFGSLDTENGAGTLDQVLQVLNTLVSQNRAVGLISHVPLVQEAIPNGFYVRKLAGGSRIETRGRPAGTASRP